MTTGNLAIILNTAKSDSEKDWMAYSKYKEMITELGLSPENYERAIYRLCKVLEL